MEAPPDLSWIEIISSVSFSGLAWYLLIITLPREAARASEERAVERAARETAMKGYTESLDRTREGFSHELELTRAAHDRALERVARSYEQQAKEHRETMRDVVARFTDSLPRPPEA